MTVSSSVGPLLHLFLCLVSESSSTDQGEALDALLLPLQGQQGSLERSVGLDQTVARLRLPMGHYAFATCIWAGDEIPTPIEWNCNENKLIKVRDNTAVL
jgi:hypothetical protein